jgi:hypothetical protein
MRWPGLGSGLIWIELITAESYASRFVRYRRLIRFPQLTMPLIAALTPPHWKVTHTDEIVQDVRFDLPCALRLQRWSVIPLFCKAGILVGAELTVCSTRRDPH